MIPFFLVVLVVHKIWKRTKWRRLDKIDLIGETPEIEAYEAELAAAAMKASSDDIISIIPTVVEDEEKTGHQHSAQHTQDPEHHLKSRFARAKMQLGRRLDRAGFLLY